MTLDLPFIWAGLIAFAVIAYVVLDGFDLGVGILFPFVEGEANRDEMMNSVAPVWDGNETWLVLGGGGLFAVFPLAYAVIMPALYAPIIAMLLALTFRGVAFEYRWKTRSGRWFWDIAFAGGSTVAALFQGVALGALVQGIPVAGPRGARVSSPWGGMSSDLPGLGLIWPSRVRSPSVVKMAGSAPGATIEPPSAITLPTTEPAPSSVWPLFNTSVLSVRPETSSVPDAPTAIVAELPVLPTLESPESATVPPLIVTFPRVVSLPGVLLTVTLTVPPLIVTFPTLLPAPTLNVPWVTVTSGTVLPAGTVRVPLGGSASSAC